ncbi:MAG: SDR family NAD(P)-dependent oxidoreductase [Betaproteobacteria bacterium]
MVVTGGGRGIGAATARLAARAIAAAGDVSAEADVLKLFDTVDRELGPVSVLVNNAGVLDRRQARRARRIRRLRRGAEGIRVNAVRPGEAEEVARAILWLASDEASCITGSLLDVTGGR